MENKKLYKSERGNANFIKELENFFLWCSRNGYKVVSNNEYFYAQPLFTTEEEKRELLRQGRKPLLDAFDKWEKAVLRGRESESIEVMTWYYRLLDLDEYAINEIPERVKYYL